jgi:RNA polymerase sigma-70 factor, ECF subfamily
LRKLYSDAEAKADWIDKLPFFVLSDPAPRKPSEVEREVIDLFERFRNPLLRYALSFGISMHDAEEVVQEVFLSLFRHLQLGKSRTNLCGWIFRVAYNLALKQRVADKKMRDRTETDEMTVEQLYDPSPDPEEHLYPMQRQRRLLVVFHAVPAVDQSCLRLRAEGLRYREIASVLRISIGSVSISLMQSLARLVRADGRSMPS